MPRRSVVREHLFEDSLAKLFPLIEEADEFIAGAEDVLSEDPELGEPLRDGIWMLPMNPVRGEDVWLYYTFDAETVTFIAVAAV